jgi:hypothetical protein
VRQPGVHAPVVWEEGVELRGGVTVREQLDEPTVRCLVGGLGERCQMGPRGEHQAEEGGDGNHWRWYITQRVNGASVDATVDAGSRRVQRDQVRGAAPPRQPQR